MDLYRIDYDKSKLEVSCRVGVVSFSLKSSLLGIPILFLYMITGGLYRSDVIYNFVGVRGEVDMMLLDFLEIHLVFWYHLVILLHHITHWRGDRSQLYIRIVWNPFRSHLYSCVTEVVQKSRFCAWCNFYALFGILKRYCIRTKTLRFVCKFSTAVNYLVSALFYIICFLFRNISESKTKCGGLIG